MRKARDPISHFRDKIITEGLVQEEEINAIDNDVKEQLAKAIELAHTEGELPPEGMYTDIYANTPPQWIRGVQPGLSVTQKYTNSEEMMKGIGK